MANYLPPSSSMTGPFPTYSRSPSFSTKGQNHKRYNQPVSTLQHPRYSISSNCYKRDRSNSRQRQELQRATGFEPTPPSCHQEAHSHLSRLHASSTSLYYQNIPHSANMDKLPRCSFQSYRSRRCHTCFWLSRRQSSRGRQGGHRNHPHCYIVCRILFLRWLLVLCL